MSTTKIQQREAQQYCKRKSQCPKSCHVHKPTLEEIKSMSFIDYVRKVVLPISQGQTPSLQEHAYDDKEHETCNQQHQRHTNNYKQEKLIAFNEGMAKIIIPDGLLNEVGIAYDRSGRGKNWEKGTKLGDLIIKNPIKQCLRGIGGIYEYTFVDNKEISVSDFRSEADKYCQSQTQQSTRGGATENNTFDAEVIQRKFWKRLTPTMPPCLYGADMEGSLFFSDNYLQGESSFFYGYNDDTDFKQNHSRKEDSSTDHKNNYDDCNEIKKSIASNHCRSQSHDRWNIGQMQDNCLNLLGNLPGVTSPYLYFGMWGSVFCAHTEDMNLLSVNYLHAGAPKIWYAIAPGHDAKRYESLAEGYFSDAKKECSEFLRHKRYLLSPSVLQKSGLPFHVMVQYPGEIIVTIPGGYHFGFNTGFNVAEATNFAVPEWIPYGYQAKVCLCRPDSVRIDMIKLERMLSRYENDTTSMINENGHHQRKLSYKQWKKSISEIEIEKKAVTSSSKLQENSNGTVHKNKTNKNQLKRKKELNGVSQKKNAKKVIKAKISTIKLTKKKNVKSKKSEKLNKKHYIPPLSNKKEKATTISSKQQTKEFWVEIMKPLSILSKASTKRKNGRMMKSRIQKKLREVELWHLAKPVSCKRLKINTRVLCMMPGEQLKKDDTQDEQCFLGSIIEIVDDHGRIRFEGLSKSDDIWMPVNSPKLFLDGGRWEEKEEENGLLPLQYWNEMDSENRCV